MSLSALQFTEIDANLFPFGISPKAVADTLRSLGDKVESGELCVQSARVTGLASATGYAHTSVRLVLIEKQGDKSLISNDL